MSTIDFTEADLRRFAPKMADFYRRALLDGKKHLAEAGILDNGKRLSHVMGQVGAETGGGTIVRESLNYTTVKRIREVWPARARKSTEAELKALVRNPVALGDWAYGGREGNRKGTTDGYDFRGGGFLQTTHRNNVEAYCKKIGVEIRPDILDDPEMTLRFACAEWIESRCNKLADANDLMGISKAINTGSATSSVVPNGMEHRTAWLKTAQAIWWDAEPVEPSEVAETVPVSVKPTMAPPTVAEQLSLMAKFSRTFFGLLATVFGGIVYVFRETVDLFLEAAKQIELLSPAMKVLTMLGVGAAAGGIVIAIAGLCLSFFAKTHDTVTGKVLK
jgi:putative chitinase